MNREVDIQVSECLDGELDESRLSAFLKRYGGDGSLRRRFSRYVIARDCLHRTHPRGSGNDIADRVMNALADEPVVLAPRKRTWFTGEGARRVLKPAAGLAVAASVATIAVLGLRGEYIGGGGSPDGMNEPARVEASRAQTSEFMASDSSPAVPRSPNLQYADAQVRQPMAQTVSRGERAWLNDYLLRHKEAAGFVGRSGFTPYVHIVATEARPRPATDESGESEEPARRLPVNTEPE